MASNAGVTDPAVGPIPDSPRQIERGRAAPKVPGWELGWSLAIIAIGLFLPAVPLGPWAAIALGVLVHFATFSVVRPFHPLSPAGFGIQLLSLALVYRPGLQLAINRTESFGSHATESQILDAYQHVVLITVSAFIVLTGSASLGAFAAPLRGPVDTFAAFLERTRVSRGLAMRWVLSILLAVSIAGIASTASLSGQTQISASSSTAKYFFGLAVLTGILLPAVTFSERGPATGIGRLPLPIFALLCLTILYQRGFVLIAIVGLVQVLICTRQLPPKFERSPALLVAAVALSGIVLMVAMRPIVNTLLDRTNSAVIDSTIEGFAVSANFDTAEVVVLSSLFVQEEGRPGAYSLASSFMRPLPAASRAALPPSPGGAMNEWLYPGRTSLGFGIAIPHWVEAGLVAPYLRFVSLIIAGLLLGTLSRIDVGFSSPLLWPMTTFIGLQGSDIGTIIQNLLAVLLVFALVRLTKLGTRTSRYMRRRW